MIRLTCSTCSLSLNAHIYLGLASTDDKHRLTFLTFYSFEKQRTILSWSATDRVIVTTEYSTPSMLGYELIDLLFAIQEPALSVVPGSYIFSHLVSGQS